MNNDDKDRIIEGLKAGLPNDTVPGGGLGNAIDNLVNNATINSAGNVANVNAVLAASTSRSAPFRVLLLRPFQTYDMASAILMKRGLETGMTAHGHHGTWTVN